MRIPGLHWRILVRGILAPFTSRRLQLFPILAAVRGYDRAKLNDDGRAGIAVALLAVPQGMAFAVIAGLPPLLGIYGTIAGLVLGAVFSAGRHVSFGPSVTIAVLLLSTFVQRDIPFANRPEAVAVLVVFAGLILVVGAWLRIGLLTRYISRSVTIGFITAAGLLILASQLKVVLGLQLPETGVFALDLAQTIARLDEANWNEFSIGLVTVSVYLVLRIKTRVLPGAALGLIAGGALGWFFESYGVAINHIEVRASSWIPQPVSGFQFQWSGTVINAAFATALLAHLEVSLIGRSFAARAGDRFDANQHMFGIGMANLGNAFMSGMPCSVSLPRTRLNQQLNAKTPLASIIAAIASIALLALAVPALSWIPTSALAALAIVFATEVFSRHYVVTVFQSSAADAFVLIATVVTGLFMRLDIALYVGAGLSIVFFLRRVGVPQMSEYGFTDEGHLASLKKQERQDPEISIVHVEGDLFFGASEIFLDQARRVVEEPNLKIIVLRMKNAHHLDATCALAIEELLRFAQTKERHIIVSGAHRHIYRVFRDSGLLTLLGRENFFMDVPSNATLSTRNALKRAKVLLGGAKASIRIYVDTAKQEAEAAANQDG